MRFNKSCKVAFLPLQPWSLLLGRESLVLTTELHTLTTTRMSISKLTDEGYGVIVIDLLGYGDCDMPLELEAYNLKTISRHFAELVKYEEIDKVIGVGH
ncbi:hypothetical protein V8C35DRAFT_307680, partial [Trichoderma chlorosporum]